MKITLIVLIDFFFIFTTVKTTVSINKRLYFAIIKYIKYIKFKIVCLHYIIKLIHVHN